MMNVSVMLGWFSTIQTWFENIVSGYLNAIMGLVWFFVYGIFVAIATVVEILQSIFMQLAGMGKNQAGEYTDFATQALTSDAILRVFRNLMLVAIVLIVVFSIIAIVKSEWAQDGKTTKSKIIGQALKCILIFLLIPSLCVGGIFLSNALLRTLSKAISTSENTSIGGQVFLAAAYSANRSRYTGTLGTSDVDYVDYEFFHKIGLSETNSYNFGVFGTSNGGTFKNKTVIADQVDWAVTNDLTGTNIKFTGNYEFSLMDNINAQCALTGGSELAPYAGNFSYLNPVVVNYFYNISKINMFVLFGGIMAVAYFMLVAIIGLCKRVLMIAALFAVSPPVIAMMPLDGGNAFNSWKKEFIGYVLGAYGAVLGMNLLFVLLQLTDTFVFSVSIFGLTYDSVVVTLIMRVLFLIVGLIMLNKDLPQLIAGFVGGKNSYADGKDMAADVVKTAAKGAGIAAGVGAGALAMGSGVFKGGKAIVGGVTGKIKNRIAPDSDYLAEKTDKYQGKLDKSTNRASYFKSTGKEKAYNKAIAKQEKYQSKVDKYTDKFDNTFTKEQDKEWKKMRKDADKENTKFDNQRSKAGKQGRISHDEDGKEIIIPKPAGLKVRQKARGSFLPGLRHGMFAVPQNILTPFAKNDNVKTLLETGGKIKNTLRPKESVEMKKYIKTSDYGEKSQSEQSAILEDKKYIDTYGEKKLKKMKDRGNSRAERALDTLSAAKSANEETKVFNNITKDMSKNPGMYGMNDVNSREFIDAIKTAFREGTLKVDKTTGQIESSSLKNAFDNAKLNINPASLNAITKAVNKMNESQNKILQATKEKASVAGKSNEEVLAKAINKLSDKIDKFGGSSSKK